MPRIVGKSTRVVDADGFSIDELAGNVASNDDRVSVAVVKVTGPKAEPWLTLHYDEWICVLKGRVMMHHGDGEVLEVKAGQTVIVSKGERFKPVFPDEGVVTEYIPVCLPAFKPERCIREDESDADAAVSTHLDTLHKPAGTKEPKAEVLYHMCIKSTWDACVAAGEAYFPPTFVADGFTHATAVPARLIETANHFYQGSEGDWICLRLSRAKLLKSGIVVIDEEAMPVGGQAVGSTWNTWICPHIQGGIHPSVVDKVLPMTRDGPRFMTIEGLL